MKEFQINLDLIKKTEIPPIQVKRTDLNNILFQFVLTDNGLIVDLTDSIVRLSVLKPSGLTVFQDCVITDALDGSCEALLNNQAYLETGMHSGELVITKGETQSTTRQFEYFSLNTIMNDNTLESSNDWETLHTILLNSGLKPLLGENTPNGIVEPDYKGQIYLDTLNNLMFYAFDLTVNSWSPFGTGSGGEGGGGPVYWADILSKPLTFVPSNHDHGMLEITGLTEALDTIEKMEGPQGPAGPQGLQGLQGLQGIPGPKGDKGDKGDQGLQGIAGPKGNTGDIGPAGEQGPIGLTGPEGPIGPKGDDGADGTGVTILGSYPTAGDLNTAHPTGNTIGDAYIVAGDLYVWNGSIFENVGRIQGPEGAQGPIGPTGPKGDAGETGIQGIQGPAGPEGAQGLKGDTGLQGPIGPDGPQGIQGIPGETGPQGIAGPEGPQGLKGDTGLQGIQGIQGPIGPDGPTGLQGPQGLKGDTGLQGPIGPEGPQGPAGAKGDTGEIGPTGPQGIQGPIGPEGLQGPQGLKGDTGDIGPQGPQGVQASVEDNLISTSIDTALSANQGRILNETKANIDHVHDYAPDTHSHIVAEIEGLQTELDGKLSKTGGELTGPLTITNKGDLKEQLKINIDRAWTFKQTGVDASSQLTLSPDTNNKTFNIMSPLGVKTLEVRVSDIPEDGYINAPVIQENGTNLSDKYLLNTRIWTGTQAEYDAVATKDATTLYFITG
jgi:hypothetical protein